MVLELDDLNLKAVIRRSPDEKRLKFILEYPATKEYKDRVRAAIADLISPARPSSVQAERQEASA